MKPVTQVGLTCYVACIASILEVSLEDVIAPTGSKMGYREIIEMGDFASLTDEQKREAMGAFERWLMERNLYVLRIPIDEANPMAPPGYSVLLAMTTDDDAHCVVCLDGRVVWNPDSEGKWRLARPIAWIVFCTLDPTLPTGIPVRQDVPKMAEIAARAKARFDEMTEAKHLQQLGTVPSPS